MKKRMKKEQIPYKKEQELEDAIITKSDYIIMNNPYQKQYMTGKYSDAIKAKAIVFRIVLIILCMIKRLMQKIVERYGWYILDILMISERRICFLKL